MNPKTTTTLAQLRLGDSFVFPKRQDPWRVMARADKSGRVAINQISTADRKPLWKHDELKRGKTEVLFLRHTIPVPGEECLVDDLSEGDLFHMPDEIIHEYQLVKHGHLFSDVRRTDQAYCVKGGRMAKVVFIKHKD